MLSGHHMSSYYAHDSEITGHLATRVADFVHASNEHYLCAVVRCASQFHHLVRKLEAIGGLDGLHANDLRAFTTGGSDSSVAAQSQFVGVGQALGRSDPAVAAQSRFMGVGDRPEIPLPLDSSSTLFVQGLPANCTRSVASHIMNLHDEETGRPIVGPDWLQEKNDLRVLGLGCSNPAAQSQSMGAGGLPEVELPFDASGTLFVDGLPAYCTRREVSYIFHPFLGYKEVRIGNRRRDMYNWWRSRGSLLC